MRIRTTLAGVLILAAVLASCAGKPEPVSRSARTAPEGASAEVGSLAPGFSLESADGTEVSLAEFRGRPVLLYFSMGPG